MSTAHILLSLLASEAGHGYDLKRRHDDRFPQARPLAYGQVYTTLQRLTRDGLAEVAKTEDPEDSGGPERTTYRITEAGVQALRTWLSETVPAAPVSAASEIFAKVVAIMASGFGDPADFLRDQRAAHLTRMRELTAAKTAPNATLSAVLSADYALNHLDADLRWMDTTAQRLDALAQEVRTS
ncbi:PadR family transcriptional regulator [Actinacidiphila soli]|jgi:DNA-binding PadR family transcriptional regulator|uniref:PadR family transcriptional regulator n=1 Tax=Actinacidiphila soli TaxID=2487275 RepID=UPI000FCA774F|nr:PadR family transcriptional regulator [Actinacidiphila soli]